MVEEAPASETKAKETKAKETKAKEAIVATEEAPAATEEKVEVEKEAEKKEKVEAPVAKKEDDNLIPTRIVKLSGPTVVGKIVLPEKRVPKKKPVASSKDNDLHLEKKKRKRIRKDGAPVDLARDKAGVRKEKPGGKKRKRGSRPEVNEEDVQKQIKDTLAKLTNKGTKSKTSKYRREKRDMVQQRLQEETDHAELQKNTLVKIYYLN